MTTGALPQLDGALLERYRRTQGERTLPIARMAYLAGAALMLLFVAWDALLDSGAIFRTLPVRAACSASFAALYFFSRSVVAARRLNLLNLLASLTAGFGVAIVLALLPRGFDLGIAGLTMVVFAGVAITPSWRGALNGSLVVLAAANFVVLLTGQGWFTFAQINGFLVASMALAVLLSFFLEQRHLRAFLLEVQLERAATTDPLTGLYNRRYFIETAERELARARRYSKPLSVLMLDIDHFKRINDTYGHPVGDEVLKLLARQAAPQLRKLDVLARLGGEEFAVLLSETGGDGAALLAERLRKSLSELTVRAMGATLKFTVSIGCAEVMVNSQGEDILSALERADEALYRAKESGRNRVVVG